MRRQIPMWIVLSAILFNTSFTMAKESNTGNGDESIRLIVNGKEEKYARGHDWRKAMASRYEHGAVTSWCNARIEERQWDWDLSKFVPSRWKHYHFTWEGKCNGRSFKHRNWHKFPDYRYSVPTFAHKVHQVCTFVLFRYNGRQQVALLTDHGPYVKKRDFDLNPALSKALRFNGLGKVEYIVLRGRYDNPQK